jgi:hypothetical protein
MMEDSNRVMTNTREDPLNTISMGWGATASMLSNDTLTASIFADLTADLTNPMDNAPMDNGPTDMDNAPMDEAPMDVATMDDVPSDAFKTPDKEEDQEAPDQGEIS